MRGPVLWLQHTSSTPDTSTRLPYVPTMLQGPLACSGEYKTKAKTTMTVQNFSLTLTVLSAKTMFKRTESTMFGVLTSVLPLEWTRMQQLPSMLGPAVYREKDTTRKTLKTMCNPRAWPQQFNISWSSSFSGCQFVLFSVLRHSAVHSAIVFLPLVWLRSRREKRKNRSVFWVSAECE